MSETSTVFIREDGRIKVVEMDEEDTYKLHEDVSFISYERAMELLVSCACVLKGAHSSIERLPIITKEEAKYIESLLEKK